MYRALAIRDLRLNEEFRWRDSYFLFPWDTLEKSIEGALREREGRGGKYGAIIYGPTGYEEGMIPSWSQDGFIPFPYNKSIQ